MEFIAMDLIGEFHPASSKGNRFALTTVCMFTGFTFCIPLKSKHREDMIKATSSTYAVLLDHQERSSQTKAPSSKINFGLKYSKN